MHKHHYKFHGKETCQIIEDYLNSYTEKTAGFPTMEGAALKVKVHTDTLNEWRKLKGRWFKRLDQLLGQLEMFQKDRLMVHSVYGGRKVSAAPAIFILKANHGMKETTVVENKYSDEIEKLKKKLYENLAATEETDSDGDGSAGHVQDRGEAGKSDDDTWPEADLS